MCGIAGFVGDSLPTDAVDVVCRMMRSLERRGPDGAGLERWPSAVLAHRRLAIFDLSDAGHQPMLSRDGQVGIVFNGAIYNFRDLRADLEKCGHRFHSESDTEVLVCGYQEWGLDRLVERLQGMFALAFWDNPRSKLSLVRDRLGVKPLVYTVQKGRLAFASTVRALSDAGLAGEIDRDAVLEFLEWGWVSDDRTIYQGTHKLRAATILEFSGAKIAEREYWKPPARPSPRKVRFDDALAETERLLLEAVESRLAADVPVAALLSGGIDSTLICWALAKLNANIRTFTVGTPGSATDESAAARETAKLIGIPHQVIDLVPNDEPDLDDLVSAYGEPFACSSALGMLRVCRAVKPHATVLLVGDGGDDVFLGYTHHLKFWRAQRLAKALPRVVASTLPAARRLVRSVAMLRRPLHLIDYATGGLGAVTRIHDGLPYYQQLGMMGENLEGRSFSHREIPESCKSARDLMPEFLAYERRTRFVAEYMTKVDGAAMFYGIEARSPLLDYRLWEFAASLPYEIRLRGGELKAVLRALVRKDIGGEVASRPKQGFNIPVQNWLVTSWKAHLSDLAQSSYLQREGWIRGDALRVGVAEAIKSGRAPNQLWYLIVLEHWLRAERNRVCEPIPPKTHSPA